MKQPTKFARWLEAVGLSPRTFARDCGIDQQQAYYLAGYRPSRLVRVVSLRTLERVEAATGISQRRLAGDAIMAAKNPRPLGAPGRPRKGAVTKCRATRSSELEP